MDIKLLLPEHYKIFLKYVVIIVLILLSFFIHMDRFGYPYFIQDGNRDYLVASHIIHYQEFPLSGPPAQGQLRNTPFYYYFLAGLLLINDSVVFLELVNVILQMICLVIIFLLASKMFSYSTGLIALLIFGFSQFAVYQSTMVWLPYVMQPFINFSFLLLLYAYLEKNYSYLIFSIVMFVLAGSLHNSAFGLVPTFIFLAILILKKQKANFLNYFLALFIFITSIFVFYAPMFFIDGNGPRNLFLSGPSRLFIPPLSSELLHNLSDRTTSLIKNIFVRAETAYMMLTFTLLTAIYYFRRKSFKNNYALIILLGIIQFMFVIASLRIDWTPFPERYFIPILGLAVIFISEICNEIFSGHISLKFLKIIAVMFLFYSSAYVYDFKNIKSMLAANIYSINKPAQDWRNHNNIVYGNTFKVIADEIRTIQNETKQYDTNFFQFQSYLGGRRYEPLEAPFWIFLEKSLGQKLTKVSDSDVRGYVPITKDDYIFLICLPEERDDCKDKFEKSNGYHRVFKTAIVEFPYVVLVAKRVEIP